jgi:hypothetical protein
MQPRPRLTPKQKRRRRRQALIGLATIVAVSCLCIGVAAAAYTSGVLTTPTPAKGLDNTGSKATIAAFISSSQTGEAELATKTSTSTATSQPTKTASPTSTQAPRLTATVVSPTASITPSPRPTFTLPPSNTPIIPISGVQNESNCDPSYPGVCIPPRPPDLDCPQIAYTDFTVLPPDPHGFDRDGDGVGCES